MEFAQSVVIHDRMTDGMALCRAIWKYLKGDATAIAIVKLKENVFPPQFGEQNPEGSPEQKGERIEPKEVVDWLRKK
jgi:hypothetical protein